MVSIGLQPSAFLPLSLTYTPHTYTHLTLIEPPMYISVPGTAAIRMLLGEGVPNTDPVWAGIAEFGW